MRQFLHHLATGAFAAAYRTEDERHGMQRVATHFPTPAFLLRDVQDVESNLTPEDDAIE